MNLKFEKNVLFENQYIWRGYILGNTIEVERMMDTYLSNYFCETVKKRNEIKELLFFTERITLDMKRQMLESLITENNPKFIKENPDFFRILENVIPHRNIFAHLEILAPPFLADEDQRKLVFTKYKNGKLVLKKYSINDLRKLLQDIDKVRDLIVSLLQETHPPAK